ncbi:MAG: HEAT repeat domain-containing protein [Dietzia sp.]
MPGNTRHRQELALLDRSAWPAHLDAHSGLPGPRANTQLAKAVADLGDAAVFDELIASGDEYRTFCGVVGIGKAAADQQAAARLRELSKDGRWRVREAVAMGLQLLGDVDFPSLERVVLDWADDRHPLVQRAAAAAICEPRLLHTHEAAATAVEVCRRATVGLVTRPADERRDADVRTLRKCLGYCWSVAVAADPEPGLAAFAVLDETDTDVAWIVRENRGKKRLARLLEG